MTNLPLRLEGSFEQWLFVAPIDWAAANGHTEVVKELLRMDSSLLHNLTSKQQMRRLERLWDDQDAFSDAAIGRSKVVKDLLREFHIGQQLPNGKGDGACIHEPRVDDLGQLIEHGLFKSGNGVWVLYIAAAAGDEGLVNQTITKNPELIKGDGEFGLSDLLYAAARGKNVHIFQQILTLAKRVKASHINGKSGKTAIGANNDDYKDLISSNDTDYVGLNYNNRTIQSKALLAAARAGNVEMVRELLKDSSTHATVLSFRDSNGTTALHAAAGRGHLEVVKLILELCPSSIYGQDGKGNTALHTAARRGCLKVATELMRFDKELIYTRNKNGETPLHLGVMGSKQPLPKLIMKQGGQIEVVKQIIACNTSYSVPEYVNWKTNEGHTALHLSVMSPRIDDKIVALLLQSPGIHVLETDKKGSTAFDLAQTCRESFPAAEFRCNIAISLLNAVISSSSTIATAGRPSTGPGSAAISVDLADPLMCSFSHDIAIPSDAESRSSERRNLTRRSLSVDWTTDFQASIASKGAPTTFDTNANDRQQGETNALPDEESLSRNLAVLRQTSIGIFETRRGTTSTIGTPSPVQCLSSLQSLFSSSTFRRVSLSGDSEWAHTLQGKKWNKFRKCMSVQNVSPQSLREQFSSTANVLFHPNTPMESIELKQEAAPSIFVSPFASPTGSTNQSPTFSSPYIKSWLKGAIFPSSSSTPRSTRQRMKKRLKQIASLTHLSFSSASETHSIHEQQVNDSYPNPRRRLVAHADGSTADRLNLHELGIPLMQDRLSRQSSMQSYMECYHPCFCLDNWCQDGQHSTKVQTKEGQTHVRTLAAQNAHLSEVASSSAANVLFNGLISRSQSSRSYKPIESPTALDQASTPTKHGHLQGPNASPARRSGGSSLAISPRPSASLSLSPWLSPSLRAARKQKALVPETTAKDGNSDEAEVSASSIEPKNASKSTTACRDVSAQGSQEDPSVRDSSAGAGSQQSKLPARQESFNFCACGPCFQEGDVHGNGESDTHTRARERQRVYHT